MCALNKRDEDGACHPYGVHGYAKICRRRSSPIMHYGGAIRKTSSRKYNQERHSILKRSRSSSSRLSGMGKFKVCSS
jgi:hypothetical protein